LSVQTVYLTAEGCEEGWDRITCGSALGCGRGGDELRDEVGGKEEASAGTSLQISLDSKIDATTGGEKKRCDYWRRVMVKRRTRILYTGAFFGVRTAYIRGFLQMFSR
jgi:hypothetical protein